jgi:chemotaxis protein methyltransferase CheR
MSQALKKLSSDFSSAEFLQRISEDITRITGVQLGDRQRHMVESRLQKRSMDLGLPTLEEYAEHYQANRNDETQALVSLLTTHHTYFFREFSHFEYIETQALQKIVADIRKRGDRKLRVWSAACSRGQEVYSLGMFLDYHLKIIAPEISWEILGSDVDPESVNIAKNGVYRFDEIKKSPMNYLASHWARGTGDIANFVKSKKSLRDHCSFKATNLMNLAEYPKGYKFDIIFCRNVFIYFTPEQVKTISQNLLSCLTDAGYFFVGISESLNGSSLKIANLGPSIYQKLIGEKALGKGPAEFGAGSAKSEVLRLTPQRIERVEPAKPLRVLCVDDSPSIHALLKQILNEKDGFEIVGKAMNGIQAGEFLKTNTVDVVTLDIHMPGQSGLEYLEKNFRSGHPATIVISSVSREDSSIAFRALELGASTLLKNHR